MRKKQLVYEVALTFLEQITQDKTWLNKGSLPSIRKMADMADCSHYTMWKAVTAFEQNGKLKVLHGRRIGLKTEGKLQSEKSLHTSAALESTLQKWEKVKTHIEEDIFSGVFKQGEALPALKELQRMYGVSHITLKII